MATKFDLYETVTNKIITSLENGVMPWVKPWNTSLELPYNMITKKPYEGINTILLGMNSYSSGAYATFKQFADMGKQIRKGEKSSIIVYASKIEKTEKVNGVEVDKSFYMLKYYNVFNIEQTEGYTPENSKEAPEFNPIQACETVLNKWHDKITYSGNQAYYSPDIDQIYMPKREQFKSEKGFYNTVFHELSHLTGHESRLNRLEKTARFGNQSYAFEELIAEISSAFISNKCGIDSIANHDSYIASWLQVLKNDKKAIFKAAKEAQKACDMVLSDIQ